jgi:hypothetical protein
MAFAKKKVTEMDTTKERVYYLVDNNHPLQFFLQNKHKQHSPLQYYDESTNRSRALRYTTNNSSVFQDEQFDDSILGFIIFSNGKLVVPRTNPTLQQFLALHPHNGLLFAEHNPEKEAEGELELLVVEAEAMKVAFDLDAMELESIAMAIFGTSVSKKKTSEIKRDVLLYAKQDPTTFLHLVSDDLTKLKAIAVKAQELGLVQLKDMVFYNEGNVLCRVPYDSDPVDTLARWLFTAKEGKIFMNFLESKLI